MALRLTCDCGAVLNVSEQLAGCLVRCPACGNKLPVPSADLAAIEEPVLEQPPQAVPWQPVGRTRAEPAAPKWTSRYWLLALALIPLLVSSFRADRESIGDRIDNTLSLQAKSSEAGKEKAKEAAKRIEDGDIDGFFELIPGHKLVGAVFPRNTGMHWLIALMSSVVFFLAIVFLFPSHHATPLGLILTGLFTATLGILLLLLVQTIAVYAPMVHGGGVVAIVFLILKLIGWSYVAAENPENGFFASMCGFTFGVGLCEELCKLLPVFFQVRTYDSQRNFDWRAACVMGLASGVGFGISEGIMYSGRSYNGISGSDIYIIRFASCVVLHAVWAAAASITLWKHADDFDVDDGGLMTFFRLVYIAIIPMLLHGLYDTLLKQEHTLIAAVVAVLSFVWLAVTIEGVRNEGTVQTAS